MAVVCSSLRRKACSPFESGNVGGSGDGKGGWVEARLYVRIPCSFPKALGSY